MEGGCLQQLVALQPKGTASPLLLHHPQGREAQGNATSPKRGEKGEE